MSKYEGIKLLRKSFTKWVSIPMIIGIILFYSGCQTSENKDLTIAASANMQYALEELVEAFTEETEISCELIVGSSGKLTAQIIEGAPFDLFLSADMKYPQEIYNEGMASGEPQVYAYGYLVIWSLDSTLDLTPGGLASDRVRHIAVANPETAPYGVAAIAFLQELGILAQVRPKLVFGESIAQTNQFILSGSAEAGITARSVVASKAARGKGQWIEADHGLYEPIAQGAVILDRAGASQDHAWAFLEFLRSPKGKEILHKFGYRIEGDV